MSDYLLRRAVDDAYAGETRVRDALNAMRPHDWRWYPAIRGCTDPTFVGNFVMLARGECIAVFHDGRDPAHPTTRAECRSSGATEEDAERCVVLYDAGLHLVYECPSAGVNIRGIDRYMEDEDHE